MFPLNTVGRGTGLFVALGTSTCSRGEANCTELLYLLLCLAFFRSYTGVSTIVFRLRALKLYALLSVNLYFPHGLSVTE